MASIQTTLMAQPEKNNHIAESYTGIYSMHKYWSKKPYNIIRDFILGYSAKGDIVLDPFCGSGISVTESIFTGRKAFGVDINPMAVFITKQMLSKVSTKKLTEEFKNLESDCKENLNSFYSVQRDGKKYTGTHFLWDNGTLKEVWYANGAGRRSKATDEPTAEDIKLASSFTYEKIPHHYPQRNFFHNPRINADRTKRICDLFTPRNLTALSILLDRIEKVEDQNIREILKFCFTSSVGQASKMVFVVERRGKLNGQARKTEKKEVGSWVIGYWVPKENFEINVWNCFENKFNKVLKAKKQQEKTKYDLIETLTFDDLSQNGKNLLLICGSAVDTLTQIPDNSVDYIITDPPHGNRIPYLEQSMMWNEWLKKEVNYEDEIVISESKDRSKNIENYYVLLNQAFRNVDRVLKPNKYFSLMFNSLDDETWIKLIHLLNDLNLDLHAVETLGYSANSVVQDSREAGLKTDFIFTFKKNPNKQKREIELYTIEKHKDDFIKLIDGYIANSRNGLEIYEILNNLVLDLLKQGIFFKLSNVLEIIKTEYQKENNKWVKKY